MKDTARRSPHIDDAVTLLTLLFLAALVCVAALAGA